MHKYLLTAALFTLAGAIFYATTQSAEADDKKSAFCYEKSVLLSAGITPTEFAAGSTIFMNKMIKEKGFNDFMIIDNNGTEIICAWNGN
ncbi:MAG: hypothetical protein HN348_23070 [Proteobacteria bacterium]|jgi:hypothetical protein|nr:hypothetical protein [Pseudomonadota bacterium]